MNIKPCPACKSPYSDCREHPGENRDGHHDDDTARECCDCGTRGPFKSSREDADAAWNAMPRRGDGLAWRKEPPDRQGWWWQKIKTRDGWQTLPPVYCDSPNSVVVKGMAGLIEWCGPIPEPPATDAEKEA